MKFNKIVEAKKNKKKTLKLLKKMVKQCKQAWLNKNAWCTNKKALFFFLNPAVKVWVINLKFQSLHYLQ